MYTYIDGDDVEIIDKNGLKKYLKECKEKKISYGDSHEGVEIIDDQLDFSRMNGWKIISYWYDDFVAFLRDIAVFVNGDVYMRFENQDQGGHIEFQDGECIIHWGVMNWFQDTADNFLKGEHTQPNWIKERLLARKV